MKIRQSFFCLSNSKYRNYEALKKKFEKNFDANRANAMAMNAVAANGVNASAKKFTRPRERPPLIFPSAWSREKFTNQKKERPLLDVRSIELPAFPGDQETES